jgi:hypothetical protein
MRTLIDLPEEDMRWLDRVAAEAGRSRAAVIREAVSRYRSEKERGDISRFFGMWKERADIIDGLDYERRLRAEWDERGA